MIINGTIYDERIYNLLDEYFTGEGKTYSVAISLDKYHNDSIDQIYKNNNKESDNSELHPVSKNDVLSNFLKHYSKPSFLQFERVSKHLISNGRAVNLNEPSKPFEVEGYFYSYVSDLNTSSVMLVGPTVFVSADGWLSDINSEIERRKEQSLGNIIEQSISYLVESGGIRINCNTIEDFFEWSVRREYDFLTHKEPHYVFENGLMRLMRVSMIEENKYSPNKEK